MVANKKPIPTKKNPELPGMERPSNDEVDKACAVFLDKRNDKLTAREQLQIAKDAEDLARANAACVMLAIKDNLEKDKNGNPTYVYRDGPVEHELTLVTSHKILTRVRQSDTGEEIG